MPAPRMEKVSEWTAIPLFVNEINHSKDYGDSQTAVVRFQSFGNRITIATIELKNDACGLIHPGKEYTFRGREWPTTYTANLSKTAAAEGKKAATTEVVNLSKLEWIKDDAKKMVWLARDDFAVPPAGAVPAPKSDTKAEQPKKASIFGG